MISMHEIIKVATFPTFNSKSLFGIERSNTINKEEKHLVFTYTPHIQSLGSLLLLKNQYQKMEQLNCGDTNKKELSLIKKNHLNEHNEGECYYCKNYFPEDELNYDHFIPLYLGGQHTTSNLKITCLDCNGIKGSIHPHQMPYSWELFKNNISQKSYKNSLHLLRSVEQSLIFKTLSELEQSLVSKIIIKELEWRQLLVSK